MSYSDIAEQKNFNTIMSTFMFIVYIEYIKKRHTVKAHIINSFKETKKLFIK